MSKVFCYFRDYSRVSKITNTSRRRDLDKLTGDMGLAVL